MHGWVGLEKGGGRHARAEEREREMLPSMYCMLCSALCSVSMKLGAVDL